MSTKNEEEQWLNFFEKQATMTTNNTSNNNNNNNDNDIKMSDNNNNTNDDKMDLDDNGNENKTQDDDDDDDPNATYDYDLIVIGGGSGGLSCGKTASDLGAKVALFDYVKPTNHGTKWNLGGTCVNVGCIPKKLMHYSSLLHLQLHDAKELGWELEPKNINFNWSKMITTVNNYVRSLNFGYRSQLMEKNIKYFKNYAYFIDKHTIGYEKKNKHYKVTGKYILLAMGGRPYVPNIPGSELAITSDDIFWWKKSPGDTLVIGASYIALENGGFLHSMGFKVDIMVRSILLRGFDRECSEFIGKQMELLNMNFLKEYTPRKLEKLENGKIKVYYAKTSDKEGKNILTKIYDTVMFATGRKPKISDMNLDKAGIKIEENGFINVNNEQTNIKNIFAVGDIINGTPELTPVAIQAGQLLAKRLFNNSKILMDYIFVPTTVFTPVEYSCCGYSEDEALDIYGNEDLIIYHQYFDALEHSGVHRTYPKNGEDVLNSCFIKVICIKSENEKIIGFHYCGPNAGEIMQGFGLAIKLGCTKGDLDNSIGIHPTTAERFTTMHTTKGSGVDPYASGC